MSKRQESRIRAAWALCLLCSAGIACEDDPDRTAAFIAAIGEWQDVQCACKTDVEECEGEVFISECAQRVVQKHEDELGSWLTCTTRETRRQAACARSADCAARALEDCDLDFGAEDACGEVPEGPSMAIEREMDQLCLEPIDCEDGSSVSGRFCNGLVECPDASDEEFCGDSGGSSSAGVAGPAPAPTPPPVVVRTPAVMPVAGSGSAQPPSCTATQTTLDLVGGTCVSCACMFAPMQAAACDDTCWALITCAAQLCSAPDAGADQTVCVAQNCADSLAGASAASALGSVLRMGCADVCPVL